MDKAILYQELLAVGVQKDAALDIVEHNDYHALEVAINTYKERAVGKRISNVTGYFAAILKGKKEVGVSMNTDKEVILRTRTYEETQKLIESMDRWQRSDKEVAKTQIASIKKMLGMARYNGNG